MSKLCSLQVTSKLNDEQLTSTVALLEVCNVNYTFNDQIMKMELNFCPHKKITTCDNLKIMTSVMPHLISELRNLWIVSNFYSKDRNMKHLMQTISRTLNNNMRIKANLANLFEMNAEHAQQRVIDCVTFLQSWMDEYFAMRSVIEKANAGSRWEFNRNALFADIEHFVHIYQDLKQIFQIFKEFENLFSLQIKSLIIKPIEIDQMMIKVGELRVFFKTIDFDPFLSTNVEYWDAALEEFQVIVDDFELETMHCMDRCVCLLSTPASGIDFLLRIVGMHTRQRVQEHMMRTSDNVVKTLIAYIGNVEHEFMKHRMNPPMANNRSKHIGAILWARALFEELRMHVMAFTKVLGGIFSLTIFYERTYTVSSTETIQYWYKEHPLASH